MHNPGKVRTAARKHTASRSTTIAPLGRGRTHKQQFSLSSYSHPFIPWLVCMQRCLAFPQTPCSSWLFVPGSEAKLKLVFSPDFLRTSSTHQLDGRPRSTVLIGSMTASHQPETPFPGTLERCLLANERADARVLCILPC